jgi:hypothetical protein
MPIIKYAHICEYARADSGGTVTIIGIFDAIHVPTTPVRFPLLHVITNLFGQKGEEFTFATRIAGPAGNILQTVQPVRIRFEQENARVSQINGYIGTVFPAFGEYTVEILVDEVVVYAIPFQLIQREHPQPAGAPPN